MGIWILVVVVLAASVWHPLQAQANSRSAGESAGLRLVGAIVFLMLLFLVPQLFDRGIGPGENIQTCPSYINSGSTADWVSLVLLGVVFWWVVGVVKATAVSVRRHERHAPAALFGMLVAFGVGFAGLLGAALSHLCA
jgi:hypothetical protein